MKGFSLSLIKDVENRGKITSAICPNLYDSLANGDWLSRIYVFGFVQKQIVKPIKSRVVHVNYSMVETSDVWSTYI